MDLKQQRKLSQLEKQGVIQAFDYTNDLAWKTMKDFLEIDIGDIVVFVADDVL